MAFTIKNIKNGSAEQIAEAIKGNLKLSRFTARVEYNHKQVLIRDVRLIESKHYCGNHPLPCPVRPFPTRHIHAKFLEGADWVAFNDMINDTLDGMEIEANAASSLVTIRKGLNRCICYAAQKLSNGIDNEWTKDSEKFKNCIGRSVKSKFPKGTPGCPEWKL